MRRLILPALMVLLGPLIAQATVYWAKPSGDHNLSGNATFCNTIRSTDTNHVGQTRADLPQFGLAGDIASAVACAKVAGDIVNVSGIDGIYNDTSGDNHTIDTQRTNITPAFALASGTAGNPTIIQTVPGDPKAEWRARNGKGMVTVYVTNMRSYLTFRNLKFNGVNSDASNGNNSIPCVALVGDHLTVEDSELYNCYGRAVESFSEPTIAPCTTNHHLTIQRNSIHDAGKVRGSGYAYYGYAQDLLWDRNDVYLVTSEFIQSYYDAVTLPGCDPARGIISNNYFHDMYVGSNPANSQMDRCGQGLALNGTDTKVFNNIIAMGCTNRTPTFVGAAIEQGIAHCPTASNARLFAWNNTIIGTGISTPDAAIKLSSCTSVSGSEIKNNAIFNYPSATGGTAIGTATIQTNFGPSGRVVTDCFVSSTDLHLKSGSNPCKDAGTTVPQVTVDFEGDARSAPYDIGADELGGPPDAPPQPPTIIIISALTHEVDYERV